MKLGTVSVKNFRSLKDITVQLSNQVVFVGENNAGKTAFFEVLDKVLNPWNRGISFYEEDFHHGCDPTKDKIEVSIEILPSSGDRFLKEEQQTFQEHIDIDGANQQRLFIKVVASYDPDSDYVRTQARFWKDDGQQDAGPFLKLREYIPFFMVSSTRDARRELSSAQGFWNRLGRRLSIDPKNMEQIAQIGQESMEKILGLAMGDMQFTDLLNRLQEAIGSVLWPPTTTGDLSLSLVPSEFDDLFRSIQMLLKNPGDARALPILQHGAGTQNLAVFALFAAYTAATGAGAPILAIDEPEVHLHPHAQRSLLRLTTKISGQVLASTHSTFVTDLFRPSEVRLLRRQGAETAVKSLPYGLLTDSEEATLARFIRGESSEFYFSRGVLLAEGQGEKSALPILSTAMKNDLDRLGVSLVHVSGAGNFKSFMKMLSKSGLDIPWAILADNDKASRDCLRYAVELGLVYPPNTVTDMETRRTDLEAANIYFYPGAGYDFEKYLLSEGLEAEYEQAIAQVFEPTFFNYWVGRQAGLSTRPKPEQIDTFIDKNGRKPELAAAVAAIITSDGTDESRIPSYFKKVLTAIAQSAVRN